MTADDKIRWGVGECHPHLKGWHHPTNPCRFVKWADEIETALERGNSPYTMRQFIRELCGRRIIMAVAPCLHGSVWLRPEGGAEIGHLYGRWCRSCAEWLRGRLQAEVTSRGISTVEINGRASWGRFLNQRGFQT